MAAALTRTGLRLPFGRLWKYGIVALVSLVAGYLIHFTSIPPCLVSRRQEHVSPNGTFIVKEYTSCYYNRISITNNRRGKVTDNLTASNWNAEPYNRWFSGPTVMWFARWESDSQFVVV
jgi:hypothetical protein